MRVLLLIPSTLKGGDGYENAVAVGEHPRMDYHALATRLRARFDAEVDIVGYGEVEADPTLRLIARTAGRDTALAYYGMRNGEQYDAVFTNGENVAVPLALLWRATGRTRTRPGHVTIGHRISTPKKQVFFGPMGAMQGIDRMFVYATTQQAHAVTKLKLVAEHTPLIAFHADSDFWRPLPEVEEDAHLVCSAGLEWRDYPTLIRAARQMPEFSFRFAAASPWSKHTNETEREALPTNVEARRYDYAGLRDLYARAAIVAVPLYENDFQAGVTTLLEAMAMGKAVIVTRTTGQTDVVENEVNGLTVAPGDGEGWQRAIQRLHADPALRTRLGQAARQWVEENATLDVWAERISNALLGSAVAQAMHLSSPLSLTPEMQATVSVSQRRLPQ